MTESRSATWRDVAWSAALALIGVALTYGVFYGKRVHEIQTTGLSVESLPDVALFVISAALGGLLAAGLYWDQLLRAAGLLAGFLVFGHLVWAVIDINVSAAFVLSNWCEMAVALLLIHATSEARGH